MSDKTALLALCKASPDEMDLLLFLLLLHTTNILSLQLNKLLLHNGSATDLSNASPAPGHEEVRMDVNESHRDDNLLLEPRGGIQIATKNPTTLET